MKVSFEINNTNDVKLVQMLAGLIAGKAITEQAEPTPLAQVEQMLTEEQHEEPQPEAPVEEKPKAKRTRKKKEEPVAEVEEAPAEPTETTPDAPQEPTEVEAPTAEEIEAAEAVEVDSPVEEEAPVEEPAPKEEIPEELQPVKKCTCTQWRDILKQKTIELGLAAEDKTGAVTVGPHVDRKPFFNDFVHALSAEYGNRIPAQLDDETRYRFVEKFNRIEWDENINGYTIASAPF